MKVLVIEDSERLRRSLTQGLTRSGFAVDTVGDGEDGLAWARHGGHDVVVLDLMLPRLDGLTLLRRLREAGSEVHVLILSAKDRVAERVEGLRLGADDYLVKPFEFDELLARLQALVRRKFGAKSPVHSVGAIAIDTARRCVTTDGVEVALTRNEFAVLEYLVARRGRVVPKSELVDHIYTGNDRGSANNVEVFVHQLRKKLGDAVIRTRRGHGYIVDGAA